MVSARDIRQALESPIDMAFVGHGFVDQRTEVRIILFQGLARLNRVRGVGRSSPGGGVEIGDDPLGPIVGPVIKGGSAVPQTFAQSHLEELFEFFIPANIEPFHAQFVLLNLASTVFPVGIHRPGAANVIEGFGKFSNQQRIARQRVVRAGQQVLLPTTSSLVSGE